jgi:hypothetical protein
MSLSWLTNSALVYEPKCGGRGSCGVSVNDYSFTHGAQINFGDLSPYLTYNGTRINKKKTLQLNLLSLQLELTLPPPMVANIDEVSSCHTD